MKKKNRFLTKILIFCCILIFVCSFLINANPLAVYAKMAPGVTTRVYENETIIYEKDDKWDITFSDIKTKCEEDWIGKASLRCEIDIKRDCTIDSLAYCDYLPMPLTINLHGHLLELDYGDYWIFDHDLTINGDNGTISTNRSGDEYNCSIWMGSGRLDVNYTNIVGFKTNMSYPIFAMSNKCVEASFSNCSFKNCSSTRYGGAICMEETNLITITECKFESCSSYYGGALYLEDFIQKGAIFALNITRSTFTNCSSYYGGALYLEDNAAGFDKDGDHYIQKFHFYDSLFTGCKATYDGGCVYIDCESALIIGDGCTITDCEASRYGGAIFSTGNDNDMSLLEISGCEAVYGGGVYLESTHQDLFTVCIHDCTAKKEGATYYSIYRVGTSECNFYNNSISNKNATGTLLSNGSIIIVSVIGVIALITAGVFIVLYLNEKKKRISDSKS